MKILCESRIDYKYSQIFRNIQGIELVQGNFFSLLKVLLKEKCIYHIRYIKYRGILPTLFRLIIINVAVKISESKIIYTCHNIYEHKIKTPTWNNLIRSLITFMSTEIIVFHPSLKNHLPRNCRHKIKTASFGDFKEFFDSQTEVNSSFCKALNSWKESSNILSPELISITTATKSGLEYYLTNLDKNYFYLVICPHVQLPDIQNENILVFNESFVKKEVSEILKTSENIIGLIGHDNISVPTSIYMFASYGIPVIVTDVEPLNEIISNYRFGEIIRPGVNLNDCILKIKSNYNTYQKGCLNFLKENSWEKSTKIHSEVFI